MQEEWKRYKLKDIADSNNGLVDGPFGSNLPASSYTEDGIPVIRGSNLSLGESRFKDDGFIFVPETIAEKNSRSICYPGDIIFTKKGTLGQIGIIPSNAQFPKYLLSSNQMKLTVNNKVADEAFVYLYLSTEDNIKKLQRESEYTGVPKINLAYLKGFEISLPPLPTQRRIAAILTALDDKIELNRRMNETLEGIAQAIWEEWFGKYANGEEELPEGWRWGKIYDIVIHLKESISPSKNPEQIFSHYSIPAFDNGQKPEKNIGHSILSNKYKIKSYSILVSKLNPRIPRIWMIGDIEEEHSICSTEFQVFQPVKKFYHSFVGLLFNRQQIKEEMEIRASGTSGSHQRVNPTDILNIDIVIPPDEEIERYDQIVHGYIELKGILEKESTTLSEIRDTLLPRLINGEIALN